MGKRRNVVITDLKAGSLRDDVSCKLTAAQKQKILRLHDVPFTPSEISRELGVPVDMVRQVLAETCPLDVIYA